MPSEHRLHPYSMIFAFLTQIRVFVVPGLLVLIGASSRGRDWTDWQPWMMLFVIPSALAAAFRYLTYRYRYEASELVIRSGLVFRKERHIPYARIQNIDAVQRVLHRLLNVVEVRIETGGGQTSEATMSVLPVSALQEMRQLVFAGRSIEAAAPDVAGPVPACPERSRGADVPAKTLLELSVRDLLLCGFIDNRSAIVIAAGFGFVWELGLFDRAMGAAFGSRAAGRGMIREMFRGTLGSIEVTIDRIAITLAVFSALLLLLRVLSMGWAIVRLYGFRVTLSDNDLRSEYGLLTRVAATIPLGRIQALTITETPLHRLFKRVAIQADTAGGRTSDGKRRERELLAPLIRRDALPEFLRQVAGQIDLAEVAWQPVAPRAFRREIKGWLVMVSVFFAAAVWLTGWYALLLLPLLLTWAIVGARKTVKTLGWAMTNDMVLFRRGWLWRWVSLVRFSKIQVVTVGESPFDRRAAMARVRVDTAGATIRSRIDIPYLLRETANAMRTHLSLEAGRRQFKW